MKKGTAMEGFIREDGTVRPIEHYDDTELRGKIQTNTDNINNLDSRVTELEEHGGVEDPTKADKVIGATAGNLASLDADGNLQDSGKAIDQSPTANSANLVTSGGVKTALDEKADNIHTLKYSDGSYESSISVGKLNRDDDELDGAQVYGKDAIRLAVYGNRVYIDGNNINNLKRALEDPSYTPEDNATKLITSKAVYDALLGKIDNLRSMRITHTTVEDKFVVSESDKAVLVTFRNSAPADTFVPVLVSLYEDDTKESDVFGLAKWSEEQQPTAIDINILVVIGKYSFSANGDYQEIGDIRIAEWTRTVHGQSFFS